MAALVKIRFEADAKKPQVTDSPFGGSEQECYVASAIKAQVEAADGKMAYIPMFKFVPTTVPKRLDLKEVAVFDDVLEADVLINIPIA